ncbi:MAG: prolyl oligopeptidase family serine peptidase [Gemmatimonadetes bacterium]|nr:prolyl oligopeptidase family serine peptidase [Gemmatimonadota bacterium]
MTVGAVDDSGAPESEPDETVIIDITGVTNGTESGTQQTTINIVDDDGAPTVTLSATPLSLDEDGSDNPSVVTATLSNPSTQSVTVSLGFTGSASLTTDYTRSGTSIVIPALSTSNTITIGAVDDSGAPESEGNETVIVDITGVTNGMESGTQQETITIIDDDTGPASVSIVTAPPSIAVSSVTFTQSPVAEVLDVSSNPVVGQNVTVSIETGGGSLGGTTTVTTDGSGRATFSNLSVTSGSPGERTLRFAADGEQTVSGPVHVSYSQGTYLDLQYCGSNPLQRLDVYVPNNSFPRPRPVVAYVHGGSWVSHDKSEEDLLLWADVRAELLGRGYVVTTLNYRLATAAASTKWPAQIHDLKCAVRHLRADGIDYGADGNEIGVWGASAGGHLVAMLGVTNGVSPAVHDFEGSLGYSGVSSAVQATVAITGIHDMTATQAPTHPELDVGGAATAFASWPGASAELDEASPIWWASSDDPPFLIIHGDTDATVDVAQSQRLFGFLDVEGVDAELQVVANADHNLEDAGGTATPSIAQLVQQVANFFDAWISY